MKDLKWTMRREGYIDSSNKLLIGGVYNVEDVEFEYFKDIETIPFKDASYVYKVIIVERQIFPIKHIDVSPDYNDIDNILSNKPCEEKSEGLIKKLSKKLKSLLK